MSVVNFAQQFKTGLLTEQELYCTNFKNKVPFGTNELFFVYCKSRKRMGHLKYDRFWLIKAPRVLMPRYGGTKAIRHEATRSSVLYIVTMIFAKKVTNSLKSINEWLPA